MKELFERHRTRLTPQEDQIIWEGVEGTLSRRRSFWQSWRFPVSIAATAGAALMVFVVTQNSSELATVQPRDTKLFQKNNVPATEAPYPAVPPQEQPEISTKAPQSNPREPEIQTYRGEKDGSTRDQVVVSQDKQSDLGSATSTLQAQSTDSYNEAVKRMAATKGEVAQERSASDAAPGAMLDAPPRTPAPAQPAPSSQASREITTMKSSGRALANDRTHVRGLRGEEATGSKKPDWAFVEEGRANVRRDESGERISVGGTDPVNGQAFDAMFFEHYGVNPFIDPEDDKFATFAVDVDNASYTLARSYLQRGALPPKDAVRVEEFLNALRHDYAPPAPENALSASRQWAPSEHGTFAIHLEAAPSPFGPGLTLFRVGLKGKEVLPGERKRANLTFVVDVSGSMNRENRIELVKRSLFYLLDQMEKNDRVALVVYGTSARVLLPSTSLRDRKTIENAIVRLVPEGSTNAAAGLQLGYQMADESFDARAINRIILCSDGVANVGITDADGILGTIDRAARRGIALTTIGFGMGNYNDVLMEKLANKGDGNYYYVDELGEARRVFVENLTGTLQTIAKQTKIQVEFDPDAVRRYRLLGYENRDVADRDFRNNAVDAGEVGAGHEVTALFEVKLDRDVKRGRVATVRIRYEDPETGRVTEEVRALHAEDIPSRIQSADPTFQMDAAVAEFAEILRHSYWAKDGNLGSARSLADKARRAMDSPKDAVEVVELMDRAEQLWQRPSTPRTEDHGVRPQWEPSQDDKQ